MGVILHTGTPPEIPDDNDGGAHGRMEAIATITLRRPRPRMRRAAALSALSALQPLSPLSALSALSGCVLSSRRRRQRAEQIRYREQLVVAALCGDTAALEHDD